MLLTLFLALVLCGAMTLMLVSAVAFVGDRRLFSSAPKEARAVLRDRDEELFLGARAMGWVLMVMSVLMVAGVFVIAVTDGIRNGFSLAQYFWRYWTILTIYKLFDMCFFDWFLLCRFHFFQHYYPEVGPVYAGMSYGFNIKSQLLKLLVVFPALSARAGWACVQL